jgi:OmpA-OmpF porin, OOP family
VPNTQATPLTPSGLPAPTPQQARPIPQGAAGTGIVPQSAQGRPLNRIDEIRAERHETRQGNQVIIREPDRTIIREGNQTIIRHSDGDRFRYGARDVHMDRRGNDNVTTIIRPNGDRIVNVVDQNGFLQRRSRFMPDGREVVIIDNHRRGPSPGAIAAGIGIGLGIGALIVAMPPPVVHIPRERYIVDYGMAPPDYIYDALLAPPVEYIERPYTLDEVRYSAPLRDRMPRVDLNTVTFEIGAWELTPDQIGKLAVIADGLNRAIAQNPGEVFLIEGHTDATGSDVDNLSLSDRRAESVAIALTQQFNVPAENLTTQGYGEQYLLIPTQGPERANRRVAVRRVTPLLTGNAQPGQPQPGQPR